MTITPRSVAESLILYFSRNSFAVFGGIVRSNAMITPAHFYIEWDKIKFKLFGILDNLKFILFSVIIICMFNLLQKFLVTFLIDNGICVSHHSDQHVKQKNRDEHLKKYKHKFGHPRVICIFHHFILKTKKTLEVFIKNIITHFHSYGLKEPR